MMMMMREEVWEISSASVLLISASVLVLLRKRFTFQNCVYTNSWDEWLFAAVFLHTSKILHKFFVIYDLEGLDVRKFLFLEKTDNI